MQLGISTYTYGWSIGVTGNIPAKPMSVSELLVKAVDFGLNLVQIGDNVPLHLANGQELFEIHKLALENHVSLEIGARGLTSQNLINYILLAEKLDSRLLRFVIDFPGYEPKLSEVVSIIRNHLSLLEDKNITLGIENHDRLLAREFVDLMETIGSERIGICLDSVNSMGAGQGLEEVVNSLAPYTVNLHVKDFGISRLPHLMGFQIDGRPAGQGMLNVPWLLDKIKPFGRCKTAVLEQWVVPEATLDRTIAKEIAWAEESIRYLGPFFN